VELAAKLESELGKYIDAGHINKIETGSIQKPLVETLELILTGLGASHRDRLAVLEAFGYTVPMTLPTEDEVVEARRLTAFELNDATYPICLVDHGQRFWAWNRYMPRIIGLHPDDPATARFVGITIFDVTFNPTFETRLLIDNPEEYLPAMLQFIKAGIRRFHEEPWYRDLVANARRLPGFSSLWDRLSDDVVLRYASRSIVPLSVKLPGADILQFRISNADVLPDPRFQILHFTPFGARTLRTCAVWAEEEGAL
jgi:hypothetical protein